jgi:hypothetical protein
MMPGAVLRAALYILGLTARFDPHVRVPGAYFIYSI